MAIPGEMLKRVLKTETTDTYRSAAGGVTPDDVKRIVEIACLAVASDGHIADEEIAAVRVLGAELCAAVAGAEKAVASENAIARLAHECSALGSREAQVERLRAAAEALSSNAARALAYKVSVATAMSDLASTDEEFEFDIDVQDALGLGTDDAERLAREVNEALVAQEI